MDPATRRGPPQLAGSDLFQLPALGLFASVMVAAQRSQVAFAGPAALVIRHRVVEVAPSGPPAAPRCAACPMAGLDQVPELAAGLVRRFLVAVVAAVAGQRADRQGEAGRTAEIRWTPGYAPVPDGLSRRPGHSHAEAGRGVGRGQRGQVPGQCRIDRPEPGDLARLGRQPKLGEQRHGQVDPRGQVVPAWGGAGVLARTGVLAGSGTLTGSGVWPRRVSR